MSKVTVIGAGMVGATCANVLASREVASEVVLIDIKEGLSEGKMLDMYQASVTTDFKTKLTGCTNDYEKTANSDVIVVTSGIPRKPGMTREELIGTNANIVKSVVSQALAQSPNAIFIIVSNPMDTMAYLTLKSTGLPKNRVIGMGEESFVKPSKLAEQTAPDHKACSSRPEYVGRGVVLPIVFLQTVHYPSSTERVAELVYISACCSCIFEHFPLLPAVQFRSAG
ncbi:MAG: hypothetical protein IKB57_02925, partial [Bacteroidaceae bacterium]|nr:hypothetical protein [Bacteroidaceae bacterium]